MKKLFYVVMITSMAMGTIYFANGEILKACYCMLWVLAAEVMYKLILSKR